MTSNRDDARRQGRREGERRKRRTLTALEARRELYVMRGRRALLTTLLDAGSAVMDDVRELVTLPADIKPTLFGSVPGMLAFAGIIRADGFVKTSRPMAKARPIQRWALVDRAKAEQWLIDHPDRPDDAAANSKRCAPAVVIAPFISEVAADEVIARPENVPQATPEKVKHDAAECTHRSAVCRSPDRIINPAGAAAIQRTLFDEGGRL